MYNILFLKISIESEWSALFKRNIIIDLMIKVLKFQKKLFLIKKKLIHRMAGVCTFC